MLLRPRGKNKPERLEVFRKMRAVATHVMCVMIVVPQTIIDYKVMSGVALTVALDRVPMEGFPASGPECWADKLKIEYDRNEAQKWIDEVPKLESMLLDTGMVDNLEDIP